MYLYLDTLSVFDAGAPFDWGGMGQERRRRLETTTTEAPKTTKAPKKLKYSSRKKKTTEARMENQHFYIPPDSPTTPTRVRARPLPPVVEYQDEASGIRRSSTTGNQGGLITDTIFCVFTAVACLP